MWDKTIDFAIERMETDVYADKNSSAIMMYREDNITSISLNESEPINTSIKTQMHKNIAYSNVKICILDTGINDSHPALNSVINEIDLVNNDLDAFDDNGHGTHIAGIIASTDLQYPGIFPSASLMIAKVLDEKSDGIVTNMISGINWCMANDANIISMSIGGKSYSDTCDDDPLAVASNEAVNQGVVVLVSVGTRGSVNSLLSPACASKVIAVGAIDEKNNSVFYSNKGVEIDIVAPGDNIMSTDLGDGFTRMSGSSMAAAYISGVVGLILEKNPNLTPAEIKDILENTAVDLGETGFDTTFGYGKINTSEIINR